MPINALDKLQVLLLDDDGQMRELIRCLLRAAGIPRVYETSDAGEAMRLIRQHQPDVAIVDWRMEPVDGVRFTRMVRTHDDSPNPFLPILMLTAYTEMSRVEAARDAGVSGFIRKPISARLLLDRLGAAIMDRRSFVRTTGFFGPDRRYGAAPRYAGPYRRAEDRGQSQDVSVFDIDEERWIA